MTAVGPLELTTAHWLNRRTSRGRDHDGHPAERWSKVLAHTGPYEQFAYGTNTPSDWQGPLQVAIICSPGSGVIAIDVDDEAAYNQTRTATLVRREQAISTRGAGWHALVDARHVPRELWPQQGPIPGADIKSKGFIPVPGSMHYSGERYEPVLDGGGRSHIVDATPELIQAMAADRAGFRPTDGTTVTGHSGGGHGGSGGHDSELYAAVTGWVRQGLGKEACYERWLPLSAPRDPSRPYALEDFERHHRSALSFIERTPAISATPEQLAAAQVMNSHRPQADLLGGRTGMETMATENLIEFPRAGEDRPAAAAPATPSPDGILVDKLAAEVLSGRYLWAAALGWMRYEQPNWRPTEDEYVREQVRLWAIGKHEAAGRQLNDAMRRAADKAEITALEASVKEWKAVLSRTRLEALTSLARGRMLRRAEDFDAHPDLVNTPTGTYDPRTDRVLPHDPNLLLTKVTRASYVPGATHPDWDKALEAIPADARDYMQLRYGQGITGHKPPDDVVIVQIGGGENGKTTVAAGIRAAIGEGYFVVISPRVLLADEGAHPTELMDLRGARIGVLEETPEDHRLRISRLKTITGPEITARLIRQNSVTFTNSCSIGINTNYHPVVAETDHGTWRRLLALVYPYRFRKPHEELRGPGDRRGDPGLRERITAGADGTGEAVLAWLMEGARRWYAGEPGDEPGTWRRAPMMMGEPPARVRKDTDDWRGRSDLVLNYISERLVFEPAAHVMAADLRADVNQWLAGHGHREWSSELLASRFGGHPSIGEHGVTKGKARRTQRGLSRPQGFTSAPASAQYAAWFGVRFSTTADELGNLVPAGQGDGVTSVTTQSVNPSYERPTWRHQERSSHSSQDPFSRSISDPPHYDLAELYRIAEHPE